MVIYVVSVVNVVNVVDAHAVSATNASLDDRRVLPGDGHGDVHVATDQDRRADRVEGGGGGGGLGTRTPNNRGRERERERAVAQRERQARRLAAVDAQLPISQLPIAERLFRKAGGIGTHCCSTTTLSLVLSTVSSLLLLLF